MGSIPSVENNEQSKDLINYSEPIQEISEQNPDEFTFTNQLWSRVLPKLRTTRPGPATTEPTYKDVAKIIGYKQDNMTMNMLK